MYEFGGSDDADHEEQRNFVPCSSSSANATASTSTLSLSASAAALESTVVSSTLMNQYQKNSSWNPTASFLDLDLLQGESLQNQLALPPHESFSDDDLGGSDISAPTNEDILFRNVVPDLTSEEYLALTADISDDDNIFASFKTDPSSSGSHQFLPLQQQQQPMHQQQKGFGYQDQFSQSLFNPMAIKKEIVDERIPYSDDNSPFLSSSVSFIPQPPPQMASSQAFEYLGQSSMNLKQFGDQTEKGQGSFGHFEDFSKTSTMQIQKNYHHIRVPAIGPLSTNIMNQSSMYHQQQPSTSNAIASLSHSSYSSASSASRCATSTVTSSTASAASYDPLIEALGPAAPNLPISIVSRSQPSIIRRKPRKAALRSQQLVRSWTSPSHDVAEIPRRSAADANNEITYYDLDGNQTQVLPTRKYTSSGIRKTKTRKMYMEDPTKDPSGKVKNAIAAKNNREKKKREFELLAARAEKAEKDLMAKDRVILRLNMKVKRLEDNGTKLLDAAMKAKNEVYKTRNMLNWITQEIMVKAPECAREIIQQMNNFDKQEKKEPQPPK